MQPAKLKKQDSQHSTGWVKLRVLFICYPIPVVFLQTFNNLITEIEKITN
jgi:hypothetical protein